MSQIGDSIGGETFLPPTEPILPVDLGARLPPGFPENTPTITLSAEEVAKVLAIRERRKGLPSVSSKEFLALVDRLSKEVESK